MSVNYSLRTSVFEEGAASEEELLRVVKSTLENERQDMECWRDHPTGQKDGVRITARRRITE